MDTKKLISAVQHFDRITTDIVSDAAIVTSEKGAVVYARVVDIDDKYGSGIIIAGDAPAVLYAISHIIVKLARRSDYTIPTIIRTIADITSQLEKEVENEV